MPSRYVRVPNPSGRHHGLEDHEVEVAFDYREDDEDEDDSSSISESQPLNRNASQPPPTPLEYAPVSPNIPGTYNFEIVDYDYPPPGSPAPLTSQALPNNFGNSNGMVPDFENQPAVQPRQPWWKRTVASVLPPSAASRLGLSSGLPSGLVGGGMNNDGVFANVTAKPTRAIRVQNGDESYLVPEDAQQEPPPSYASAQADAVPPYWETTIHAPFSPESMGEMIVDSLPTGSLFSFCWNMLVSISFQFVGFILTYLLHTSHAARLGSRAGLGVTLIQYGFALGGKMDPQRNNNGEEDSGWSDWYPSNSSSVEAWAEAHKGLANFTTTSKRPPDNAFFAEATADWLSFFLMTMGWFILLTSLLGFYRVKRWERSILGQQQLSVAPAPTSGLESAFSLRGMSRIELLRNGFGLNARRNGDSTPRGAVQHDSHEATSLNPEDDPHQPEVYERERRLVESLRLASLI